MTEPKHLTPSLIMPGAPMPICRPGEDIRFPIPIGVRSELINLVLAAARMASEPHQEMASPALALAIIAKEHGCSRGAVLDLVGRAFDLDMPLVPVYPPIADKDT